MTDSKALRSLIEKKGLKLKYVAAEIGLSAYGLQKKIDNRSEFKAGEIRRLCEILGVDSLSDKEKIFFGK